MAWKGENQVVNLAGLVQGITLVTFPAATGSPRLHRVRPRQHPYGTMFLPQVLTAITMSMMGRLWSM